MSDRLTDVLHPVLHNPSGRCTVPMLRDAVRGWLKDAINAKRARFAPKADAYEEGWHDALDSLEATLGIKETDGG